MIVKYDEINMKDFKPKAQTVIDEQRTINNKNYEFVIPKLKR